MLLLFKDIHVLTVLGGSSEYEIFCLKIQKFFFFFFGLSCLCFDFVDLATIDKCVFFGVEDY